MALALVGFARPASAQSPVDVSIGYQYLVHSFSDVDDQKYPAGFNVDVSVGLSDAIRVVVEGNWSRDSSVGDLFDSDEATLTATAFGGGLRWASHTEGIATHLQLIAGVHHDSLSTGLGSDIDDLFNEDNNNFMLQPGFGIVIPIAPGVGILGQADYRRVFYSGDDTDSNLYRFVVGLRFGR
jgi:hypothetical protein